jgi:hypothetical protein
MRFRREGRKKGEPGQLCFWPKKRVFAQNKKAP